MNERIKELYQQAYDSVHEFQAGMLVLDPVEEKFAELIVKECAGRVDHILRQRQAGGGTMGDDIRVHFGVEE
jgi:hypothetical protein